MIQLRELIYPFRHKKEMKHMLLCIAIFVFMAVPFKAMTLVEGFTEVRPVNAVPVIAGLLFGPAGAWGCAIGNVVSDLFGSFSLTSLLGFFGNFIAAYVPYRIWHIVKSGESPNVKTHGNLGFYIYISGIGAMATGIFITGGLDLFFGYWSWDLMVIIMVNDFLFPVFLGLPVLIVLTSDDHQFPAYMPSHGHTNQHLDSYSGHHTQKKVRGLRKHAKKSCCFFAFITIILFFMFNMGMNLSAAIWLQVLGGLFLLAILALVFTDG